MPENTDDVEYTRLEVYINDETVDALKRLKGAKGISITEAVRRAVTLYDLVDREMIPGSTLRVVNRKGKNPREIRLLH